MQSLYWATLIYGWYVMERGPGQVGILMILVIFCFTTYFTVVSVRKGSQTSGQVKTKLLQSASTDNIYYLQPAFSTDSRHSTWPWQLQKAWVNAMFLVNITWWVKKINIFDKIWMEHFVFTIYLAAAGQISETTTDWERKQIVGPVRKQQKCSFKPNIRGIGFFIYFSRKQLKHIFFKFMV